MEKKEPLEPIDLKKLDPRHVFAKTEPDEELREKVAEKLYVHAGRDAKWPHMEEFYLEVAEDIIPIIQRETRREIIEDIVGRVNGIDVSIVDDKPFRQEIMEYFTGELWPSLKSGEEPG